MWLGLTSNPSTCVDSELLSLTSRIGGSALQSDTGAFCFLLSEDNIHSWIFIIPAFQLPLQILQYPPTVFSATERRTAYPSHFIIHWFTPRYPPCLILDFVQTPICTSEPSIRNSVLAGFNAKEIAICRLWLQVRKLGHRFLISFLSVFFLSFSLLKSLLIFFFLLQISSFAELLYQSNLILYPVVLNTCLPSST